MCYLIWCPIARKRLTLLLLQVVPNAWSGFAKCNDLVFEVIDFVFATSSRSSSSFVLTCVNLTVQCGIFLSFFEE